jgi:hypothetical protein
MVEAIKFIAFGTELAWSFSSKQIGNILNNLTEAFEANTVIKLVKLLQNRKQRFVWKCYGSDF